MNYTSYLYGVEVALRRSNPPQPWPFLILETALPGVDDGERLALAEAWRIGNPGFRPSKRQRADLEGWGIPWDAIKLMGAANGDTV
jgi:hypothetical protein